MVKLLVVGIVAAIATLGGIAGTLYVMQPKPAEQVAEKYDWLKLEAISVPILRNGKVSGYVIAGFSGEVRARDLAARRDAVSSHLNAAAFRVIYDEPSFDFKELKPAEMAALGKRVVAQVNKNMASESFKEVIIENLNYLTPEQARNPGHQ